MRLATTLLIQNQFRTICASFDNFRCAFPQLIEDEYIVGSSAKLQTSVSLTESRRSFMKRLNKIGPNIDPCGTPLGISRYQLNVDFI